MSKKYEKNLEKYEKNPEKSFKKTRKKTKRPKCVGWFKSKNLTCKSFVENHSLALVPRAVDEYCNYGHIV